MKTILENYYWDFISPKEFCYKVADYVRAIGLELPEKITERLEKVEGIESMVADVYSNESDIAEIRSALYSPLASDFENIAINLTKIN